MVEITPAPTPSDPGTAVNADGYTIGKLLGKNGRLYTVLFRVQGVPVLRRQQGLEIKPSYVEALLNLGTFKKLGFAAPAEL